MSAGRPTRTVRFVVALDGTHPERLEAEIGVRPDRTWLAMGRRMPEVRAVEGTWEIGAEGGGELGVLIRTVLSRVRTHKDSLAPVCTRADATCSLTIVQSEETGFALDVQDMTLLAELNALLEVGSA
ncbi:MAG TPA: DUF4279 domain-containing protein [Gaiellaceae bacterium]|nr:DUF4279 domain-containing protein [Gaiellaceae bacterium]